MPREGKFISKLVDDQRKVVRTDAARDLLRMGLDLTQIAEATGLSLGEVEALRRGMDN